MGAAATIEVVARHDHERNKLEYVDMKVGKGTLLTMVDSGVTHNFIKEEAARKVGLKFSPTQAHLKAVNFAPDKVISITENVDVNIGEWSGNIDFTILRMDDSEAVFGMEFLKQYEAMMVPHMKKLYIYDGWEMNHWGYLSWQL